MTNPTAARALLAWTILSAVLAAQVVFEEDFLDAGAPTPAGPAALVADGWLFSTQDGAPGAEWRSGDHVSDSWMSYGQPTHLTIDALPSAGQPAAAWAVLPALPDVQAGDQVFFASRRWAALSTGLDRWELRWSPGGGTDTGAAWDDVGDFTVQLPTAIDECAQFACWDTNTATLPASGGRLALRYVYDVWSGGSTPAASIDDVTIVRTSVPPLPAPGEEVHWSPAAGPIVLLDEKVVPPGATLVIDAGTEVRFATNDGSLRVQGTLRVEGTPGAPVSFTLADGAQPVGERVFVGFVDFALPGPLVPAQADVVHLESEVRLRSAFGAGVSVAHSMFAEAFTPNQRVAGIEARESTLALDDVTFVNGELELYDSYLRIDASTFDNAPLISIRSDVATTMHIDGIDVRDYVPDFFAGAGPLVLHGSDHYLGPANVIVDNPLPVTLYGGGLAPGSVVPATGNAQDIVEFTGGVAQRIISFARLDVPYVWRFDSGFSDLGGIIDVEPGTTIEFEPDATVAANFSSRFLARGTPDAPITLTDHVPGAPWRGLFYGANGTRPVLEHCVLEGAEYAVMANQTTVWLESCVVRDNEVGVNANTFGSIVAHKTRFLDNDEGVQTSAGTGHASIDGTTNPNEFVGNVLGFHDIGTGSTEFAEGNWWGDPTGPTHPQNPGGGDSASISVDAFPFLTRAPDFTDHPPRVELEPVYYFAREGDTLWLHWTVEDDGAVVAQRLEYTPHSGNPPLSVLVPAIDPAARSIEIEVPEDVPSSSLAPPAFRIVAVDDAGQEGFSDVRLPLGRLGTAPFTPLTDLSAGVSVGQRFAYEFTGVTGNVFLFLDESRRFVDLGQHGYGEGVDMLFNDVPAVSTDLARYAVFDDGWYFGELFSIRPHASSGELPPSVTITSPAPGTVVDSGGTASLQWTAADDEGLRGFDVQASYDGAITWHSVVRGLPGTATGYDWAFPTSAGVADLRVRVVAIDERFGTSSDTLQLAVAPEPLDGCQTDLGFAGPGAAVVTMCGDPLATGGVADIELTGAAPGTLAWLVISTNATPTPFATGTLVPVPIVSALPFLSDASGEVSLPGIAGGGGPLDVVVQFVIGDSMQPAGWALSNALQVELLP